MVVELKDILRRLDRFDDHDESRSKKEVAELRSIGDKLDQLVTCLTDISTSLKTLSIACMTHDYRGSVDDPIFVYDCNELVGAYNKDGNFVKTEELENVVNDDLVNRFNDVFHELDCYFTPKEEKEEGSD